MNRSDFTIVDFDEDFNPDTSTHSKTFTITGSEVRIGDGYMIVQTRNVSRKGHTISINGTLITNETSGDELPPSSPGEWNLAILKIPSGVLQAENTIEITRVSDGGAEDNFRIGMIIVHWREMG